MYFNFKKFSYLNHASLWPGLQKFAPQAFVAREQQWENSDLDSIQFHYHTQNRPVKKVRKNNLDLNSNQRLNKGLCSQHSGQYLHFVNILDTPNFRYLVNFLDKFNIWHFIRISTFDFRFFYFYQSNQIQRGKKIRQNDGDDFLFQNR